VTATPSLELNTFRGYWETTFEQARLLTLFRTVNPLITVDHIWQADAYFGGTISALPLGDGIFPESVNTQRSSSLVIEWLAEVFPHITVQSKEVIFLRRMRTLTTMNALEVIVSRRRGILIIMSPPTASKLHRNTQ
jgi:hypothetical protein